MDPSHATGMSSLIKPLVKSAVVAGADGLMIEVHPNPEKALCDGAQSVTPAAFADIMSDVKKLCEFENKTVMLLYHWTGSQIRLIWWRKNEYTCSRSGTYRRFSL